MIKLPEIFNNKIAENQSKLVSVNPNENVRWIEFTAHISQFNQSTIPDTQEHLQLLLDSESDPGKLASLYVGLAKCYIGDGDFIKGSQTLGYAHQLIENNIEQYQEVHAFILLEMVGFLGIINNHSKAILILETIPRYTKSKYLLKLVDYYRLVQLSRQNKNGSLEGLITSSEYFKSINSHSTLAYHFKTIGNLYGKRKDFDIAMDYYLKGIEIAEINGYQHIKSAIHHDIGMWKFATGDFNGGINTLRETAEMADSSYTQSFTLANIGFIYNHKKDINTAEKYFKQAHKIAFNSGVFYLIPGISYYLGKCNEQKSNISTANEYFEQAYQTAIELIDNNFECRGDIRKAIKNYLPFLKKYKDQIYNQSKSESSSEFLFSKDKSLNEIREIFQKSLFTLLSEKGESVNSMSQNHNISVRKLYQLKSEIKDAFIVPNEIENYLKETDQTDWKLINQEFDQKIINCLLSENKHNKRVVADKLGISYPGILKLTNNNQMVKL